MWGKDGLMGRERKRGETGMGVVIETRLSFTTPARDIEVFFSFIPLLGVAWRF